MTEQPQTDLISGLRILGAAADELNRCPDVDSVLRRAVEFARDHLGVERCRIFLEVDDVLEGTYGIDLQGELADEHSQRSSSRSASRALWLEHLQNLEPPGVGWTVIEDAPYEWDTGVPVGTGWIALTPMRAADKLIGVFVNDCAISASILNPVTQELVTLFCAFLGIIVERKQAEEQFRQSEERFEKAFHSSPLPIAILTLQHNNFLDMNARYLDLMGFTREQLIGQNADENVHASAEDLITIRRTMNEQHFLHNFETTLTTNTGHRRDVHLSIETIEISGESCALVMLDDITERKRAEKALSDERTLLRTVIDTLPDYIFAKDLNGRFTLSNAAHARAANVLDPNAFIGKEASDFFPENLASQFDADDREVLQSGQPYLNLERTTQDAALNPIVVSTTKVPLRDAHGSIIGLVGISRDITAYKQAQDALQQQEMFLRQVIDAIPGLIFVKDWDGNYILVNQAHADTMGKTVEATIGKRGTDLGILSHEIEQFLADDREVMSTLEPKVIPEEQLTSPNTGEIIWLRTIKIPLVAPEGQPPRVLGVAIDITQRKLAEQALQASEERYRSLVELSPDGIVVYRGNSFVYVNDAAIRLLRARDANELLARTVTEVIHEDCFDRVWTRLQQTQIDGKQVNLLEGKLVCLDGQEVEVEIMAAPILFENAPATQMIIRDVTERKRAEEAQRESENLRVALEKEKELGDLKTRFMITISHEFRTPLTIAFSSAELLEKFYDRMSPEQRTEHLHKVETQISKVADMIQDVTQIIHATFERQVLNFEPTDLRQLCALVIEQIEHADDGQHRIIFNADDSLPALMVDEHRIRYILTNLLSNALKYSSKDQTITLDLIKRGMEVVIQVADQGIGIPLDEQPYIFDPFYRARNIGTIRGSGLGLSTVREIVEMHGGTIHIRSEVNQGTQVTIRLPQG